MSGETPDTGDPWSGPYGYVGLTRSHNEDGEIETHAVRIFLSLDQAKQWARAKAREISDDQIEEKLKRLTGNVPFIPIEIGPEPEPPEEGREEEGGTTQFVVVPGIPVM